MLTKDEDKELDMLAFKRVADLPFGPNDQARMKELQEKACQGSTSADTEQATLSS